MAHVVVHHGPRLVGLAHVGVSLPSGVTHGLPLQLAGQARLRTGTLALHNIINGYSDISVMINSAQKALTDRTLDDGALPLCVTEVGVGVTPGVTHRLPL